MNSSASSYCDEAYLRGRPFRYRSWLYKPFLRALVKKAKLKPKCSVLDVGCGQGFFSHIFADFGLRPLGVDLSAERIRAAEKDYGLKGARFEVGDAVSLGCAGEYDCVFVRGLSLYNCKQLEQTHGTTKTLLEYLKSSGIMIFAYATILSPKGKGESWTSHSLADAKKYFSSYPGAKVYFSLRVETLLFGSAALSWPFTVLACFVSRITGFGGDLIALVPRSSLDTTGSSIDRAHIGALSKLTS